MRNLKHKNPDAHMVMLLYAIGFAVLFVVHLVLYSGNLILSGRGDFEPHQLTMEDFEWEDIEERDGSYVTTGGDPRIYLKDSYIKVDSVEFDVTFSKKPLMINVFWGKTGQDYSVRRMAYDLGGGRFWLPAFGGQNLRIDTGAVAGNVMEVHGIYLNRPRPWYSFFIPSAGSVALFIILPGLAACCVKLAHRFKGMLHARRAVSKP